MSARKSKERPRPIPALTVKQPWAWAIVHAGKDIENRDWVTHYRGPLLVHAGARLHDDREMPRGIKGPADEDLVLSAIVGIVELADVVERSRSRWFGGSYGWVLARPKALRKPVPCSGRLGFWYPTAAVSRAVMRQIARR